MKYDCERCCPDSSHYPLPVPAGRSLILIGVFEIKWTVSGVWLQTENGRFESLPCSAQRVVLDGEIVSLDETGNSQFRNLLFCPRRPTFLRLGYAVRNGEDLQYLPIIELKPGAPGNYVEA